MMWKIVNHSVSVVNLFSIMELNYEKFLTAGIIDKNKTNLTSKASVFGSKQFQFQKNCCTQKQIWLKVHLLVFAKLHSNFKPN